MAIDWTSVAALGLMGAGVWYYYNKPSTTVPDTPDATTTDGMTKMTDVYGASPILQALQDAVCAGKLKTKQDLLVLLYSAGVETTNSDYQRVYAMTDAEFDAYSNNELASMKKFCPPVSSSSWW